MLSANGEVTVRVPAKINLHLGVGDARDDGYHELTTVFSAISLYDEIRVRAADSLTVRTTGDGAVAELPTGADNLAGRAAELLAAHVGRDPGVAIDIIKHIPIAGGMAGGSADAAGTLVALDRLWRTRVDAEELHDIAARLGSDVPFLLHGGTALGTGRGENLMPVLSRGELHWVIAIAGSGLSTPEVYRELDRLRENNDQRIGKPDGLLQALASADPHRVAPLLANDLQAAAVSLQPALRRTLRAGVEAGALAGIVSGSGPTCVFLCSGAQAAVSVAAELAGAGVCKSVRTASGPVHGALAVHS